MPLKTAIVFDCQYDMPENVTEAFFNFMREYGHGNDIWVTWQFDYDYTGIRGEYAKTVNDWIMIQCADVIENSDSLPLVLIKHWW